jgi:hypothetical protein
VRGLHDCSMGRDAARVNSDWGSPQRATISCVRGNSFRVAVRGSVSGLPESKEALDLLDLRINPQEILASWRAHCP